MHRILLFACLWLSPVVASAEAPHGDAPKERPSCFSRCADSCSLRSGNMSVDACTTQCTVGCSRDNGKMPAPPAPEMQLFAAIAIAPSTLEYATIKGFITRNEAESAALKACAKNKSKPQDCTVALWFRGTCGSLAIKDDPERKDWGWGADWAQTSQAAEAQATRNCNNHVSEKSCAVVTTMCAN
ncbi:MAG: DUF4189 domain-containing protein [Alphaproteobacteria bacterium]|nr:DUF4189 domain-containing protein [Alphaproteobacteria bacterium]